MAHLLELAVKNAVDDVNEISHFRDFIDSLYKIYSMSPKNEGELEEIAKELSVELLKIHKIFDIRWVFSSYQVNEQLYGMTCLHCLYILMYAHVICREMGKKEASDLSWSM